MAAHRPPRGTLGARVPEPEVMDDDGEARAYAEADFGRVDRGFARRIARRLGARGERGSGQALDLGTGPASIPVHFLAEAPDWRVTALDASEAMLALARERVSRAGLETRVRLVQGDAKRLSMRTRFDLVFSNSLLHHLGDPVPFWSEIARVARPGAWVLVQDLRRPATHAAARALVEEHAANDSPLLRQLFHQSLLAAYTPREVREQLIAAGLERRGDARFRIRAITDRHLLVAGRIEG